MQYEFFTQLQGLYDLVLELNQYLEADKTILPQKMIAAIEENNVKKLTVRNAIEKQMQGLQADPSWPAFYQDVVSKAAAHDKAEASSPEVKLWLDIQRAFDCCEELIAVNSNIVHSSLHYYTLVYKELVKAAMKDQPPLTYDKKAEASLQR